MTLDRSTLEAQGKSSGADRAGLGLALPSQLHRQAPHLGTGPGSLAQVRTSAVSPRPTLSPASVIVRPPGDQASPTPNTQPHITKSPLQPLMHTGGQTDSALRPAGHTGFKSSSVVHQWWDVMSGTLLGVHLPIYKRGHPSNPEEP